ncbi:MAG: hypothetical protein HRF49_04035 [bacterium]|jgi:curli biogenesis system outer membrane secretion channel CsgG
MKRVVFIITFAAMVLTAYAFCGWTKEGDEGKKVIFVAKFEDASGETGRSWWYNAGIQDVGEVFRSYIKNRLLKTGQFRVFDFEKTAEETERLNQIAAQVNPGAALDQSGLQIQKYVIEGTIANVAVISKGGGGLSAALGVGKGTDIVSVQVLVNMRDQETGETIFSEQVNGEKKRETWIVATEEGASATGSQGERAGDVGFALEDAANAIVDIVIEKFPIEGTILKVEANGKEAYVDLGSAQGLKVGDILVMGEYLETDLGVKVIYEWKETGSCVVSKVIDETTCKVSIKKGTLREGATVRVAKKKS